MAADPDVIGRAFGGARFVALGLAVQKVASIVLNQCLLRVASPELLGVASVRLELVLNTILFVSREGFRLALARSPAAVADGAARRRVTNCAYCAAIAGAALALGCALLGAGAARASAHRGGEAFLLYCAAAALESASEPLHALAQARLVAAPRAVAEPAATLARGAATLALLRSSPGLGAAAFGWGQVAYAAALGASRAAAWAAVARRAPEAAADLAPSPAAGLDAPLARAALGFTAQSVLKHALTECDRVALAVLATARDAGLYAFAQNYGAIVARLFLQPTEEAARLAFAKLDTRGRDGPRAARLLGSLLRCAAYLGLLFAALGAPFAPLAVRLLRGAGAGAADLEQCGAVLAAYCAYVPFLALNGVAEAFAHAAGGAAELRALAAAHGACAVLFAALAGPALRAAGTVGLVYAAAAAMAARGVFCGALAAKHLGPARAELAAAAAPDAGAVAAFAAAGFAARRSGAALLRASGPAHALADAAPHVAVGVAGGLAVLAGLARDRAFFRDAARLLRAKED